MSSINTNSLDVNYPIPGQNNSTQGFRNNFVNIKQNLDIAGNEISDLQNKVVVKSALANTTLNNDMANTLISNASTLQFRATTYNLGNALVGNVAVNCSLGDVQYGNLSGNITLNFSSWAPTNTEGHVSLHLGRPNANVECYIFLPNTITNTTLLENFVMVGNTPAITFPYNCTQINLTLTSTDCGTSLSAEPTNRPYKSTSIQYGEPPSTGRLGDTNGTIYMPNNVSQLKITTTYSNDYILTSSTSSLYVGMPVCFTAGTAGVSTEANITLGTTYYVSNINSGGTLFKVSANANTSGNVDLSGNVANMYVNPVSYIYVAVDDYNATSNNISITSSTTPNIVTLASLPTGLAINQPIIFTKTSNTGGNTCGLTVGNVYYIKTLTGSNVTLSMTRNNGAAGPEFQGITTVTSGNVNIDCNVYIGSDIFRRIPLMPF